ncbi:hypothetical protein [Phreatobacter sp.]|uniref:hypothetical protein n=1 Tax=Phreatobacter sp. TaxID=1966341 RepID=UPI0025D24E9A|nr:hypothetical protein [Phreatobacter sp.]
MTVAQAGRQDAWMQRFREGSDAYRAWLKLTFEGSISTGWQHGDSDPDDYPDNGWPDEERCFLLGALCQRAGEDLARYSDQAAGYGLYFTFSNACSRMSEALTEQTVERDLRVAAIRSLPILYRDFFAVRFPTGQLDDRPGPLADCLYMLWDMAAFGFDLTDEQMSDIGEDLLDVLAAILAMENVACTQSALHGLNHKASKSARASKVIDEWLKAHPSISEELRAEALAARGGLSM